MKKNPNFKKALSPRFTCTTKSIAHEICKFRETLESKMESVGIIRSKIIGKVQKTYTGGCWSGLSRDFLKNVGSIPIY
ncbi:hypothetical protein T08_9543 [Trichinella sp. T8]|nr:hypothetical protein T08_9543 [Trichinella sp. T8]